MAHPTGPGHEVGAYHHPSALAHDGWYLPPNGSEYQTAPPYGSGYSSAPTYGGGTGWYPTGPGHEVDAYHHSSAPAHSGRYLPPNGSGYPTAPPYGSEYSSAPTYGGGTGWYPTGPGHEVDAFHHPSAPAHSGRYLPPNGRGYPTAPPYGSEYSSAPAYGGGTGWYPTGWYHAPGYVPYIYAAPAAAPVQQHQNRPVIPGIVAAGIEALAIGVFKATITNNLCGDGSGFNF